MNANVIPSSWNTIAKAIALYNEGERGRAFKMVAGMRIRSLTPEEKKTLDIAGEMLIHQTSFYQQLGYKLEVIVPKADEIFTAKIIKK